jgi:hypothetical protein
VFVRGKNRSNVLAAAGQASIVKAGPLLRSAPIAAAVEHFIAKAAMGPVENERALAAVRVINGVAAVPARALADQYEISPLRSGLHQL